MRNDALCTPEPPPELDRPAPATQLDRRVLPARILCCAVTLILCNEVWQAWGLRTLSPTVRRSNEALFDAVDQLASKITTPDAVIYIVTQDFTDNNLLWRKVAYQLVPHRTLLLPYNWAPVDSLAWNVPKDPTEGNRVTIGSGTHFSGPDKLALFLKSNHVTHLLICSGDANAATAVGLPLQKERMYLIQFDPTADSFTEVASASLP